MIRKAHNVIFHHERTYNRSEQIPSVHMLVVMAHKDNFPDLEYNG